MVSLSSSVVRVGLNFRKGAARRSAFVYGGFAVACDGRRVMEVDSLNFDMPLPANFDAQP